MSDATTEAVTKWVDEKGTKCVMVDSTLRPLGYVTASGTEIVRCPVCWRAALTAGDKAQRYFGHVTLIVGSEPRSTDECSLWRPLGDPLRTRREEPWVGKGPIWSEPGAAAQEDTK